MSEVKIRRASKRELRAEAIWDACHRHALLRHEEKALREYLRGAQLYVVTPEVRAAAKDVRRVFKSIDAQ